MKQRKLSVRKIVAILALVLGTFALVGCGSNGNPIAPKKVCTTPGAPNYGQEGDCLPVPVINESWVQLDIANADPKPGTILFAIAGGSGSFDNTNSLLLYVKFGLSEADKAEVAAGGHNFSIVVCLLTKDKKEVPSACALTEILGPMTETRHRIMVSRTVTQVTETHFARVRLVMTPQNSGLVLKVFKEEVYELFYGWKTP